MASESAALFWFNWRTISDGGHSMYGAYVYRQLLPHFSPARHDFPTACYYFYDGDCLPRGPMQIPYVGPAQAEILKRVLATGPDLFYVVAVFNMGDDLDLADVDRGLGQADVCGYSGMTSCPAGITYPAFNALTGQMSLPYAFAIRFGKSLEKESFAFLSDDELRAMGFEPSEGD